ncbi:MAG TPA: GntR family transcriptional regulator [Ferrovibrio sp.]|jgi:GntR family carbon starvation induced transcriptional regulator|uniref:GntR family transcriptional regulator n=1 Tax=Ferrovibrio sp. TaxID=1917215 RepID=UPI002B4B5FBA|nr:GntR family transcriptional regulator [Ferrovibrio sp.]HLT75838.1 GntR family transcriptional regulator [Ferrovibrio sp.]
MKIATDVSPSELAPPDVVTGTKSHRAYTQIRNAILTCRYMPGTKLNIAALANELDVSLGAVREALSMLQSEALVISEPQRGYTVSPVSPKELNEITEARIAIESLCLRASVERGDLAWESRLVASWHRLSRLSQTEEGKDEHLSDTWARAHADFHAELVGACGNDWLLRIRAMLYEQSERYRRMSVPLQTETRDVPAEHKAIFDAVMERDADRAVAALEAHLRKTAMIVRTSVTL